MREYVNTLFPLERRNTEPAYLEMFNIAASIDFMLKDAKTAMEVVQLLTQSDTAEIGLSRLSAYVHEKRTGDKDSAASLLAIKPPGTLTDLAPQWKLDQAATYSQNEFRRRERAKTWRTGEGGGDKGKGKGKEKKKGPKKE